MKEYEINDYKFYVGNNQLENNRLIEEGTQSDIWFHLDKLPSPHGILKCNEKDLTKTIATQCCIIIKELSKFKNIRSVSVIYCSLKNIRRTNTPGKVIVKGKTKKMTV